MHKRHLRVMTSTAASHATASRMVKIFEFAFQLEVTSLPSPELRLVFRSILIHTQRQ